MFFLRATRRALPALVTAALLAGSSAAGAQTGNGDQQQALQNQVVVLTQAQNTALAQLQGVQQQKAVLDAKVSDLTNQINGAEARLGPLASDAARLDTAVADLQRTIVGTQARLADARRALNASAAQLYRSARAGAQYATLLSAGPRDLVAQSKYLSHITRERQAKVHEVSTLQGQLERQRTTMAADQAKADAAASTARALRDQLVSARDQLGPAEAQAAAQAAAEQTTLKQIQGSLSDDKVEIASLQAASDAITAALQARGGVSVAAAAGGLAGPGQCQARPVPGAVTSPFGPRGSGFHPGVDMHALMGDPIHACRGGVVVSAGWKGGYGNAVVIDHGGGMATLYGHQSRLGVTAGQTVSAGDVIGYIGSTGFSTGPHLHFEVRINGKPINPAPYLIP